MIDEIKIIAAKFYKKNIDLAVLNKDNPFRLYKLNESPVKDLKAENNIKNVNNEIKKYLDILLKENTNEQNKLILRNIESLKIKNKIGKNNAYYVPFNNTIYLNRNMKESLPHEIIHVASSYKTKDVIYCGFCQLTKKGNIGIGLNEGFTELFNKEIFKEKGLSGYSLFEVDVAKEIRKLLGKENVKTLYFNADLVGLSKCLLKYDTKENIVSFIKDLDFINENFKYSNVIKEKMLNIYLTLYKWKVIKLNNLYKENKITKDEYEVLVLDNSKIYPSKLITLLNTIEPITNEMKEEVRRSIK